MSVFTAALPVARRMIDPAPKVRPCSSNWLLVDPDLYVVLEEEGKRLGAMDIGPGKDIPIRFADGRSGALVPRTFSPYRKGLL